MVVKWVLLSSSAKWPELLLCIHNFAYFDFEEINKSVISWCLSDLLLRENVYQQLWRKYEKKVFAALMITENVFSLKWTGVTISAMFGSGDKTYQFFFRYLFMWSLIFWKDENIVKMCPQVRDYHGSPTEITNERERTDERNGETNVISYCAFNTATLFYAYFSFSNRLYRYSSC